MSQSGRWYHCTDHAKSILRNGFTFTPKTPSQFSWDFDTYEYMLGPELYDELQAMRADDKKYRQAVRREWLKRFGGGAMIWVADPPDLEWGKDCLEFIPPPEARLVHQLAQNIAAFWYPEVPIPKDAFRLVREFSI